MNTPTPFEMNLIFKILNKELGIGTGLVRF